VVNLNSRIFITTSVSRHAVAAKFFYTPFGEVIDRTINNPDCDIPVGFAGAFGVIREPNGLYYMNARYYDPSTGRFLSEDPLGLGGGDLTLYSYAGNNPVVFVDPSGLCASSGGPSSFKDNLTRNLYTVSDITNKFSTDMALLGVGNQIITGGVPTQLSTVPYGISLGSYTVSVLAGGAGDFLRGDYNNLELRATAAVPQYFMNIIMGSNVAEKILQGAAGNYFDTYARNPYRP
jgi:RHS repeat-associated protein